MSIMKKMETRALVEGALLVAIAAVLMIASAYVPFFMMVGAILWPIPVTILTFKYDLKFSMLSLVVLFIITSILTDPLSTLTTIMMLGIPSAVLGFCLRKRYSPFTTVVSMSLSMFIMMVVVFKFSTILVGQDMVQLLYKQFDEVAAKTREMLKSMGMSEQEINSNSSIQAMNSNFIKMVFPGLLAMGALFVSFLNYYVVGKIFKRLRIKIEEMKPLDQWYVGRNLSFGVFFITIASWLLSYLKVPSADVVFNSIFLIFNYIFLFNGLAVIAWYLKKKGISGRVRVLLIVLILFTPLSSIIFYLGLVDYVLDLRKINPLRGGRIPPGK